VAHGVGVGAALASYSGLPIHALRPVETLHTQQRGTAPSGKE
jgi:hypothetical protein